MSPARVRAVRDPSELARAAADVILARAAEALSARGVFHVALSGGSTPRAAYAELARRARTTTGPGGPSIDLARWHFWFGDERCVPSTHADSNYRMASESLFAPAAVTAEQVHRIRGELEPERGAELYEKELALVPGEPPRLDLVLLGLGVDGHTASLFPGTRALEERERSVVDVRAPNGSARVTLTLVALNAARSVVFLVAGREKREVLRTVLADEEPLLPAGRVRPRDGELEWIVDREALGERKG